jgi:hypothetical protein
MFELNCSADHACVTSTKRWSIMAQREKLTEKLVRAAEPRAGIYQVFDEDVRGFSLRIFSSGSRHFALDYRVKGRQRRFTIGRWPEWTVTAAREQAKALRRVIDDGGDPLGEREAGMAAPRIPDLIDRYIETGAAHPKPMPSAPSYKPCALPCPVTQLSITASTRSPKPGLAVPNVSPSLSAWASTRALPF